MSSEKRDAGPETTHFGYEEVPVEEKAGRVGAVFDSVASNYDLMNDLMSGGLHRIWKRFALARTGIRPGQRALDLASGSGDLALGLARRLGSPEFFHELRPLDPLDGLVFGDVEVHPRAL